MGFLSDFGAQIASALGTPSTDERIKAVTAGNNIRQAIERQKMAQQELDLRTQEAHDQHLAAQAALEDKQQADSLNDLRMRALMSGASDEQAAKDAPLAGPTSDMVPDGSGRMVPNQGEAGPSGADISTTHTAPGFGTTNVPRLGPLDVASWLKMDKAATKHEMDAVTEKKRAEYAAGVSPEAALQASTQRAVEASREGGENTRQAKQLAQQRDLALIAGGYATPNMTGSSGSGSGSSSITPVDQDKRVSDAVQQIMTGADRKGILATLPKPLQDKVLSQVPAMPPTESISRMYRGAIAGTLTSQIAQMLRDNPQLRAKLDSTLGRASMLHGPFTFGQWLDSNDPDAVEMRSRLHGAAQAIPATHTGGRGAQQLVKDTMDIIGPSQSTASLMSALKGQSAVSYDLARQAAHYGIDLGFEPGTFEAIDPSWHTPRMGNPQAQPGAPAGAGDSLDATLDSILGR